MAFNLQSFRTRALSAIVFVVIMAAGLFTGHWSFLLLISLIHFGCWNEYIKLVKQIDPGYQQITDAHHYGVMIAGWSFLLWMTNDQFSIGTVTMHEIGWWLIVIAAVLLPIIEIIASKELLIKNVFHSFFGLLYISLTLGCLVSIRSGLTIGSTTSLTDLGLKLVCAVIAANWINDTMAYIVGSLIGRTPFSKISPKKTWEGTIGGAILAIIGGGLLFSAIEIENDLENVHWYTLIGIAAIAGTVGDLFESKLKRLAGVKDSGNMMPGHGGFLDRFDSLLFAAVFCWLYIRFFIAE